MFFQLVYFEYYFKKETDVKSINKLFCHFNIFLDSRNSKFLKRYVIRQHIPRTSFSKSIQRGKEMYGCEAGKWEVMEK